MKPLKTLFILLFSYTWALGQSVIPLTVGQVNNYEVGDTFIYAQTMHDQYPITYTQKAIISKTFSANNDTVSYGVETKSMMVFWGPPPSCCQGVTEANETLAYTNLNDTILQILSMQNPHGYTDTAVTKTDTSFTNNGTLYNRADLYYSPSSCYSIYTYGAGLGCTYSYWICPIDGYEMYLSYYHKKDGRMAGQPRDFLTGLKEIVSTIQASLSPNPANESFQLQLSETPAPQTFLYVYDILGREVRKEAILSYTSLINRNGLAAGLYFWQLENSGNILNQGKLTFK